MTKFKLLHLKNEMFFANFIANLIGVFFVQYVRYILEDPMSFSGELSLIINRINAAFTPCAFVFVCVVTIIYERPIRRFLNLKFRKAEISHEFQIKSGRRLINEPFFLMVLDFSIWLISAFLFATVLWTLNVDLILIQAAFFNTLITGLITVNAAFFLLGHVLQKKLAPYFFPEGGLYTIPKTFRIRISTRLVALLFACNLLPLFSILNTFFYIMSSRNDPAWILSQLRPALFTYTVVFVSVGILLTILESKNLTIPFKEIIAALQSVRNGSFDKKVLVTTNDEIGYTGDAINEMTEGLIERQRMQQSLNLAKEVQQNLLPKSNLKINGFDIAGKSIYCDETGGDYYDFITIEDADKQKIGVAIGDVSGHGVPSALLMATVRSSLRQRASLPGSIAKIVSDVNRQLAQDVEDSGQFMTMFFLALDTETRHLQWVRAGHDPAIIYDPRSDSFHELGGSGIALGVDADWVYKDNMKSDFSNGQIIFFSTDGIWEARNKKGEMLGKKPILNAIRQNSSLKAEQIVDAIFNTLVTFIDDVKIEDDITAVVIKMQN
jgi:sigma-B regulation protein RsbU (phosphoserine phosphatase)